MEVPDFDDLPTVPLPPPEVAAVRRYSARELLEVGAGLDDAVEVEAATAKGPAPWVMHSEEDVDIIPPELAHLGPFDQTFFEEVEHMVTEEQRAEPQVNTPAGVTEVRLPQNIETAELGYAHDVGDFSPRHAGQYSPYFTDMEHASISDNSNSDPRIDSRNNAGLERRDEATLKRRTQNREASARFRARAKQRDAELNNLKSENTGLRFQRSRLQDRVKHLESMNDTIAHAAAEEALTWVRSKFWLRLKISLHTVATCVLGWVRMSRRVASGVSLRPALMKTFSWWFRRCAVYEANAGISSLVDRMDLEVALPSATEAAAKEVKHITGASTLAAPAPINTRSVVPGIPTPP